MTPFHEQVRRRERLLGTLLTLPAAELAEMATLAGFDWLWLDMEHGLLDVPGVQRAAMAAGIPCLARVPVNEEAWIKRVLDTGVDGLIIPQVNTPEQAEKAARFTRYPPVGVRSVGMGRAQSYGPGLGAYVARANAELILLVQIEHIQAVRNLEAILDVAGVDGIIVGPYDLSASLNLIGQVDAPEVRAAIETIQAVCDRRGVPAGIFATDVPAARRALRDGFSLVSLGTDVQTLSNTWIRALAEIKS
jgi:2-keto-3-deoxy-L-rhamnonate aldolase RhmA